MNVINSSFKNIFRQAIDSLIAPQALSSLCKLKFNNSTTSLCNNCVYDPISKTSSGRYNNIGPSPFANGMVCPVCVGLGTQQSNSTEHSIYLAVIFDSKYFLNISNKVINIPDNSIQTLCSINELKYINNCSELIVESVPNNRYERAIDPIPCGLGDQDYIITLWKQK